MDRKNFVRSAVGYGVAGPPYAAVGQVLQELPDLWNVRAFGAIGDGETDDTAAIQAAIDAAEVRSGTVFVPIGVYIVSPASSTAHCLTIDGDGVTFQGEGYHSVVKVADRTRCAGMLLVQSAAPASVQISGVTVRDIRFDGNKANQSGSYDTKNLRIVPSNQVNAAARLSVVRVYSHSAYASAPNTAEGGGISLEANNHTVPDGTSTQDYFKQEIVIPGCFTWDNDGWGIGTNWSNGVVICDCHSYNNDTMGVTLWNSQDITVSGCNCYDNAGNQINVEVCDRVVVSGCHTKGIVTGIKIFNSWDVTVTANHVENVSTNFTHHAVIVANGFGYGGPRTFKMRPCRNISILGNTVRQSGASGGYALGINDTTEGLTTEDVLIQGNRLLNTSIPTKALAAFAVNLQVVGNRFEGGVFLDGKSGRVSFNDNHCAATPTSAANHLTVAGGNVIAVTGNVFDLGGASTQHVIVAQHARDVAPIMHVGGNSVSGTFTGQFVSAANAGNPVVYGKNALDATRQELAYGVRITTDASSGDYFRIVVTDNDAATISNPLSPGRQQQITYEILNDSGGRMGRLRWGSEFKLAGSFTNPGMVSR